MAQGCAVGNQTWLPGQNHLPLCLNFPPAPKLAIIFSTLQTHTHTHTVPESLNKIISTAYQAPWQKTLPRACRTGTDTTVHFKLRRKSEGSDDLLEVTVAIENHLAHLSPSINSLPRQDHHTCLWRRLKEKKKGSAAEQLCSHTLNYFITFPVQTPTANATCPSSSSAGGSRHRCQASYLDRSYRTPASHQPSQ